ncbi:WD repeat-containing protein on Y chromosome-like isoform X2 [Rhopilema esculentum]|uniref:WD repeat-containing protein on Y chromosome-like isoform X2 n=1 Tax=Rhopilema esculentum TaxID=499914 RepID=UPI0031DE03A9|eukprot:gene9274-16967_t
MDSPEKEASSNIESNNPVSRMSQQPRVSSGKSNRSFKHLVRILGPALKVHLGVTRNRKDKGSSNPSVIGQSVNIMGLHTSEYEFSQLEEKMDISHLNKLMTRFELHFDEEQATNTGHVLSRDASRSRARQKKTFGMMDLEQFKVTLAELLGIPAWEIRAISSLSEQAELLFRKIDRSHEGLINWDNFCTYIIMRYQEQDLSSSSREIPFIAKPRVIKFPNIKETISKVMLDYNPTRFVTISKEGIIGIWSMNFELMRCIDISSTIEDETIYARRRTKLWVTDAICMPNVNKLAVASTNRDISFFDMSTPTYKALFHLCALPQVPMCLEYHYEKRNLSGKSMLLYGTDRGEINILIFHMPRKGLFEKPFKKTDTVWRIFFTDLSQHATLVSHSVLPHVHSDWIRRVTYLPENDMLISCSSSSKESLVFRSLDERKRKTYIFKVTKGIDCFDFCKEKTILATGGVDHVVRLWDPYVTFKPVAILKGHQASVIDVAVHPGLSQVFSYSKDGCLKSWDIKEHYCIQSISIRLPFNSKNFEHGSYPFFLLPKPFNTLLISVGDCFAELKLGATPYSKQQNATHARPLCSALYNPAYKQVITGSEGSEIVVWDIETGKRMLHLKEVHDGEELSCMALDGLGERLITGARDGTTMIWNLTTGLLEKQVEAYEEAEITGIIAFPEREQILTVGWSRKLLMYSDTLEGGTSTADPTWSKLDSHTDDILSASYYPPNLIATSSFDGGVFIWSLEREKIYRKLKAGKESILKKKIEDLGLVRSEEAEPVYPVDNVLFLTNRSYQESAVLVTTEAGKIEFWPVFGVTKPSASFHAASTKESTILSVHTDALNNYLISGDSKGVVVVWDISRYCNVKTFKEVVDQVLNRKNGNLIPHTNRDPPFKHAKWSAHFGGVVSVQFVAHESGSYVVSGSTDGSVKLWTLTGALVGMFGQHNSWDLSDPTSFLSQPTKCLRTRSKRDMAPKSAGDSLTEKRKHKSSKAKENGLPKAFKIIPEDEKRPYSTPSMPVSRGRSPADSNVSENESKSLWTNTEYYRSRTMIVDDAANRSDVWSILGENYNESFRRRMNDRKSRRNHFSQVDGKLVSEGAVGANVCSPFKALYTPETSDFQLPQGLPVTPRMMNRGVDPYKTTFLDQTNISGPSSVTKFHMDALPPITKIQNQGSG